MSKEKPNNLPEISPKLRVVLEYKKTGKPMKQFKDAVGKEAGIPENYANKLLYNARRKSEMNTMELIDDMNKSSHR